MKNNRSYTIWNNMENLCMWKIISHTKANILNKVERIVPIRFIYIILEEIEYEKIKI
jgi:hypothetical protein